MKLHYSMPCFRHGLLAFASCLHDSAAATRIPMVASPTETVNLVDFAGILQRQAQLSIGVKPGVQIFAGGGGATHRSCAGPPCQRFRVLLALSRVLSKTCRNFFDFPGLPCIILSAVYFDNLLASWSLFPDRPWRDFPGWAGSTAFKS